MKLSEIAVLSTGHSFRGGIPNDGEGAHVVQMGKVDPILGVQWDACIKTRLVSKKSVRWLEAGDILFLARGTRNLATYIADPPEFAVAATAFYLIRVSSELWEPEALATYLSRGPFQAWLDEIATGAGNQRYIPLNALKEAHVPVVEKEIQTELIAMARQLYIQQTHIRRLQTDIIERNAMRLTALNEQLSLSLEGHKK